MTKENEVNKNSAMHVMAGVHAQHDGVKETPRKRFKKRKLQTSSLNLAEEIEQGSRLHLARGITLLESIKQEDQQAGQELLLQLLPKAGNSIRLGITGVPGAGKSTFIEAFGLKLAALGHKVAVLAIDPSSTITGGSILGDKTRMETLAGHPNAFIRPSPSAGTLGGVHKKSRETMLLCEAAGYDVILIETVGVGQSETVVRSMVDMFILLALTGAGDELQGMKKGVMELVDMVIVHKADGANLALAQKTVREYKQILHLLQPVSPGWMGKSLPVSSIEKKGFSQVWTAIQTFTETMKKNGYWESRRNMQTTEWFHAMITNRLVDSFFSREGKQEEVRKLEHAVLNGEVTVTNAVDQLFD